MNGKIDRKDNDGERESERERKTDRKKAVDVTAISLNGCIFYLH